MNRRHHPLLLALAACLTLALAACSALSSTIPASWEEGTVRCPNEAMLQEAAMMAFNDMGYKVTVGIEPGERRLESAWLESRSPYKDKGRRYRAHLEYEREERGVYALRVRVEEEKNASFDPLNPEKDEWRRVGDSVQRAQHVLARLHGHLGDLDLEVGPDPTRQPR